MAEMAISLSDLLQEVGMLEQQLNVRISDDHLNQVSLFLTSWTSLAPFLGLDQSDMEVVEAEGRGEDKRLKMLQRWKIKYAFKATYRKLIDALLNLKMAEQAEKVCRLLQPEATSSERGGEKKTGSTGEADRPLSMKDLPEVSNYLMRFDATQLHNLGMVFGLDYDRLKRMKGSSTFNDDLVKCWIEKLDRVEEEGIPTWRTFVAALRHQRVRHNGLANEIERAKGL